MASGQTLHGGPTFLLSVYFAFLKLALSCCLSSPGLRQEPGGWSSAVRVPPAPSRSVVPLGHLVLSPLCGPGN